MFAKMCDEMKNITSSDYTLLNKENNTITMSEKHTLFNMAKEYNMTVIWNEFSNYIIVKKDNYSIIKDYDINHFNMGYFKHKNILFN